MSDYRYSIVEHQGVPCVHVLIDCACETLTQTNIPLVDILLSAIAQGYILPELVEGKQQLEKSEA